MHSLPALARVLARPAAAGAGLGAAALALALLLNPEFPWPSGDGLVLGLLFVGWYALLWAASGLLLGLLARLCRLARWRRQAGVGAAGEGEGRRRPSPDEATFHRPSPRGGGGARPAAGGRAPRPAGVGLDSDERGLPAVGVRMHLAALAAAFTYLALAFGLNAAGNRTTVPPLRLGLLWAGAGILLLVAGVLFVRFHCCRPARGSASASSRRLAGPGGWGGTSREAAAASLLLLLLLLLPLFGQQRGAAAPAAPAGARGGGGAAVVRAPTGLRVILLGIDSASWPEMEPLMRRGLLPHLSRLVEEGCRGTLVPFAPTESPLLWASMATGKLPRGHGVRFFLLARFPGVGRELHLFPRRILLGRLEGLGLLRFSAVDGRELRAAAFWDVATRGEQRVGVVNWWQTYPAAQVDGYIISDHVAFVGLRHASLDEPGLVHPPELAPVVAAWWAEDPPPSAEDASRRFCLPGGPVDPELEEYIFWRCYEPDERTTRLALRLLETERPVDLFAAYWNGLDPAGHWFWHFAHPEGASGAAAPGPGRYAEVLARYYAYMDEIVGRILAHRDQRTAVVVVSDHGMEAHGGLSRLYSRLLAGNRRMTGAHRRPLPGILILSGAGIRQAGELGRVSILDVSPTLLALLGYPPAADMEGRVLGEALDPALRAEVERLPRPASYDLLKLPLAEIGEAAGGAAPVAEEDYQRQLEKLGYLE